MSSLITKIKYQRTKYDIYLTVISEKLLIHKSLSRDNCLFKVSFCLEFGNHLNADE
jgi:hypothetical protein